METNKQTIKQIRTRRRNNELLIPLPFKCTVKTGPTHLHGRKDGGVKDNLEGLIAATLYTVGSVEQRIQVIT